MGTIRAGKTVGREAICGNSQGDRLRTVWKRRLRTQIQVNGGGGLGKETVLNKFAVMSKVRTRLWSLALKRSWLLLS